VLSYLRVLGTKLSELVSLLPFFGIPSHGCR
jgi:hypothetical protein